MKKRQWMTRLRESRGMTQADLAEKVGVHEITVSRWERGERHPNRPNAKILADVLDHPEDEFLTRFDGGPQIEGIRTAPVVGRIMASNFDNPALPSISDAMPEFEYVETPGNYDDLQHRFVLRVVGDSMDQIVPDGSLVLCAPVIENGLNVFERATRRRTLVVVQRRDPNFDNQYEYTVKELVCDGESWLLRPRSSKKEHQKDLKLPPLDYDAEPSNGTDDIAIVALVLAAWKDLL